MSDVTKFEDRAPQVGSVRDRMKKAAMNAHERLMILLDHSGSMAAHIPSYSDLTKGSIKKMDAAKQALEGFVAKCDKRVSAVGLVAFESRAKLVAEPVQYYQNMIFAAQNLHPEGGTGLLDAMEIIVGMEAITRCIIISDGVAGSPSECSALAKSHFATKKIPCDCVFIGNASIKANELDPGANDPYAYQYGDASGARLLKEIAEITRGYFFLVTDFANFQRNLNQLEASERLKLTHQKV